MTPPPASTMPVPEAVIVPPDALVMVPYWARLTPMPLAAVSLTCPALTSVQLVPAGP
jgi:hypothetical protein